MSVFEQVATSKPVNGTAGRVVAAGTNYECPKRVVSVCQDLPLPTRPLSKAEKLGGMQDLSGVLFGRFTVIGRWAGGKGWVCRCACGMYAIRQGKAALNPANSQDCCEPCRHLLYLKRTEEFRRTGFNRA